MLLILLELLGIASVTIPAGYAITWAISARPAVKPAPSPPAPLRTFTPRPAPLPPWKRGDAAFWLDPDLWTRTPEVDGRPELCWMHLDDEPTRYDCAIEPGDYHNVPNFGGSPTVRNPGDFDPGPPRVHRRHQLAACEAERTIKRLLPVARSEMFGNRRVLSEAEAVLAGRQTTQPYRSRLDALQAIASELLQIAEIERVVSRFNNSPARIG